MKPFTVSTSIDPDNPKKEVHLIINGDSVGISVTSALGLLVPEGLKNWFVNCDADKIAMISKVACDAGNDVHKAFERILNGEDIQVPLKYSKVCDKFKEFLGKQEGLEVLGTEVPLFHDKYKYGGTCDAIVKVNGKIEVWDYKTSKKFIKGKMVHKVEEKMGWQVGAYKEAIEFSNALGIIEVDGMRIINCNPKIGTIKSTVYQHYDFCITRFLKALDVWKAFHFNLLLKKGLLNPDTGVWHKWTIEDLLLDTALDYCKRKGIVE